jgi:hypothetical protein
MRGEDGVGSGGCAEGDAGAGAAQASSVSKARRVVLAGAVLLALGAVAAVAIIGGEAVKTGQVRMELSDRNEFEGAQSVWYCVCAVYYCVRAGLLEPCGLLDSICTGTALPCPPRRDPPKCRGVLTGTAPAQGRELGSEGHSTALGAHAEAANF